MSRRTLPDRKTRILDAAERVFADSGFDGASLRQIVENARVNLATVYYYFQSKEGLMQAVFKRRFGPLKQQQLDLLAEAEASGSVEKILEAVLLPALQLATAGNSERHIAMKLIGRAATEPNPQLQDVIRSEHAEVRLVLAKALRRALPKLPPADLTWRIELIWSAVAFVLCNPGRMERVTGGVCNPGDTPMVWTQMSAFFSAGLRAPAANTQK